MGETETENQFIATIGKWKHQVPENEENDYYFEGYFFVTAKVNEELKPEEISNIYIYIKEFVASKKGKGIDYLQVFKHSDTGETLFFIDDVAKSDLEKMTESERKMVHNCTLLFASDY